LVTVGAHDRMVLREVLKTVLVTKGTVLLDTATATDAMAAREKMEAFILILGEKVGCCLTRESL